MTIPHLMLLSVVLTALVGMALLYRSRASFPTLPPWSWRNIIALIALIASIFGAAVITALVWAIIDNLGADADRLISELVRDPRAARSEIGNALGTIYSSMANNLLALTLGLLAILIGFGFAITKRKAEGEFLGGKFKWGGGDDDEPSSPPQTPAEGAKAVAGAAQDKAEEIIEETKPAPGKFTAPPGEQL